ncbi:hypothetical protein TURU_076831 [Turdus rufiventris]|nr:hypothetical protein TURU_076831 [Turdus rufiventris]
MEEDIHHPRCSGGWLMSSATAYCLGMEMETGKVVDRRKTNAVPVFTTAKRINGLVDDGKVVIYLNFNKVFDMALEDIFASCVGLSAWTIKQSSGINSDSRDLAFKTFCFSEIFVDPNILQGQDGEGWVQRLLRITVIYNLHSEEVTLYTITFGFVELAKTQSIECERS